MKKGVVWGLQGPLSTVYTASGVLGLAGRGLGETTVEFPGILGASC